MLANPYSYVALACVIAVLALLFRRRPKRREWPRYDYDFSDLPTIRRDSEALFVTERVRASRRIGA